MTNLKFTTKTAIALSTMLAVVFCVGCSNEAPKQNVKKYTLSIHNGHGWSAGSSTIDCDSFKMVSTKECIFWNDGKQMNIKCEDVIYPMSK